MNRRGALAAILAVLVLTTVGAGRESSAQSGGWTPLLDGSSLQGWNRVGDANWRLAGGVVEATSGAGGYLVTPNTYQDFELALDIWVSEDANSGVFIRCQDPKSITSANAYEVNVYDRRPDPAYRTGAIVDVAKPMVAIDAGGRWNTLEITARGPRLTVTLNGQRTVDVEHTAHLRGPIALQYGSGTVRFRNVRVRALQA